MAIFEITVQHRQETGWPVVAEYRSNLGQLPQRSEGVLILPEKFEEELRKLHLRAHAYGTYLGKALFKEDVRDRFKEARTKSGQTPLHILLVIEPPELKPLRWERLCAYYGSNNWDFLALDHRNLFSRYLPSLTYRSFPAIGKRDLRALAILANPPKNDENWNLASFDVEATAASINTALGEIPYDLLGPVEGAVGPASKDALYTQITEQHYTLLHLVAHGQYRNGETIIYLLDADHQVAPLDATDLIIQLNRFDRLPYLAFLSTCESAKPEAESALGGLAHRLVRDLGIPSVVAMTDPVSIVTAEKLSAAFYRHLREHGHPDQALTKASAGMQDRPDILFPALYSRLGERPLFSNDLANRSLTNTEIKAALVKIEELLPVRAPVLLQEFRNHAEILRETFGTDPQNLSDTTRQERDKALDAVNNLSDRVFDLFFPAVAFGETFPAYNSVCPFPGLNAFQTDEQQFFFGRTKKTEKLTARLRQERFLAVLGESGCGKSSLVLAGMIPALEKLTDAQGGALQVRTLTPGVNPVSALKNLLDFPPVSDWTVLLVLDQFEKLFTLCTDPEIRKKFLADLLGAWKNRPDLHIVLTLRDDFLSDCILYPEFEELMRNHQERLRQLPDAELRRVIRSQADQTRLRLEDEYLIDEILENVTKEPGAMSLHQHLLRELWKRRHGRWLARGELRKIEETGRVVSDIASVADTFYNELPNDHKGQGLLRNLFLRLIRPDETADSNELYNDTPQRENLDDLVPVNVESEWVHRLIQQLADTRLLITFVDMNTDQTKVEISHKALIRHWHRLQNWLNEDREILIKLASVRQQAKDWQKNGEQNVDLPGWGTRLQQAEAWFESKRFTPNKLEDRFIQAIKNFAEKERKEKEAADFKIRYQLGMIYWNNGFNERNTEKGSSLKSLHYLAKSAKVFSYEGWKHRFNTLARNAQLAHKFIQNGIRLDRIAEYKKRTYSTFSINSNRILIWGKNSAQVLDNKTVEPLSPVLEHNRTIRGARFNRDGSRVCTWSLDRMARIWDSITGKPLTPMLEHNSRIRGGKFNDVGSRLLTWTLNHTVWIWDSDADADNVLRSKLKHESGVDGAVFNGDGSRTLTWCKNGKVCIWNSTTGELLITMQGHEDSVNGAVYNADERRILTWSNDHTAQIWDSETGGLLTIMRGHKSWVLGAVFSSDESRILTWGQHGTARIWDSGTGKQLITPLKHQEKIRGAVFNTDGSRILTWSDDSTARVWNSRTGKSLFPELKHKEAISGAIFNADESCILTWSKDGTACIWDSKTGTPLSYPFMHKESVGLAAFTADESRIVTWCKDGTVRIWENTIKKSLPLRLKHNGWIFGATFYDNERRILTWSDDGTARFWDSSTGQPSPPTILKHEKDVNGAVFSNNENRILTWSEDGTARVWENSTGKPLSPPLEHGDEILGAMFNNDESGILTWSRDGTARVWNNIMGEQALLHTLEHKKSVDGAMFNDDGSKVLTWSSDGTARIWDSNTGKPLTQSLEHNNDVNGAIFNSNESSVLTWSLDGTARIWDSTSGKSLLIIDHKANLVGVIGAMFNRDESKILTWGKDGTVQFWNSGTGESLPPRLEHKSLVFTWVKINGIAFSNDESRILTWGQDGSAQVWDSTTGKQLIPKLEHNGNVNGAMFNADESRIVTWSSDGTVRIWDSSTGSQLTPLLQHKGQVDGAVFNSDESRLLTWSWSNTARVWDISVDEEWPADKIGLKTEVDTGTKITSTGEVQALSVIEWQKKKWCEYDAIQYRLGRISEENWQESQRLCEQLKSSETE